jgi:hypothetical protein
MIVAPIFNNPALTPQWVDKLIHYRDAYAFGHLFSLCERIGVEASLVPHNRLSEYQEIPDVFCVGGPVSNVATSNYLRRYVQGLRMVDASGKDITVWQEGGGYMLGQSRLFETDAEQVALLIKITKQELGQHRTVHLLFGYGAMATAAAGYYLWKRFAEIHAKRGEGRYCVVVRLARGEGYKSVRVDFEDYTDAAFKNHP